MRIAKILRRTLGIALLATVLLASIASAVFLAVGGRFHNIQTPSMGTYAPVGTLVLSMPTTYNQVRVGQPVFFTPPGGHEIYFHRVASKDATGIKTSGDLTGSTDPWLLQPANITGHEVARVLYVGWLLPVLPILLVGGIVVHVFTRFFMERFWRFPLQVFGWSLVLAIANYLLQPLVRAVFLAQVVHDHVATIRLVATGILPLNVHAVNGDSRVARIGEVITLHTAQAGSDGRFNTLVSVHMEWWTWLGAALFILGPLLLCVGYLLLARRRGWDLIGEPAPVVKAVAAVMERVQMFSTHPGPAVTESPRRFARWQAGSTAIKAPEREAVVAAEAPLRAFNTWG
jgi:hypothetical protein